MELSARDPRMLAATIVRRGYDGPPPLIAGALAEAFAIRLTSALAGPAHELPLFAWIERTCASLPLDARAAHMLGRACANVAPLFEPEDSVLERLSRIGHDVTAKLERYARADDDHESLRDKALDATIASLLIRLDGSDPFTAEHSRAVSLWCRRLATRLGLDDMQVKFAGRCGLLHDVGKSRTPKTILNAPRALSDDEWAVMRDHTISGYTIVTEVEPLRAFLPAVRSHHERLDGKGYPDRLSADFISPMVRIVTVADSFNAMIGRRPYRQPMSPALALEQLVKNRGTQFDPTVVEAMIDIVEHPMSPAT